MERNAYITDEDRKKCQGVADAFKELYELTDIVVVDTGKYGFVKLRYCDQFSGFDCMGTYTDCQSMFDSLWDDWLCNQLLSLVQGTPIEELEYEEIFRHLSEEKQNELMSMRIYFQEKCKEIISI